MTDLHVDSEATFKDWAKSKYSELVAHINPCNENGELDPNRLNQVLVSFAQHYAWAITMQEVEANSLNVLQHGFESWQKSAYNTAYRLIREESGGQGRAPGQVTVDARIVDLYGDEMKEKQDELAKQKSRVDLLKGFIKVLDKQAGILQTISSNMRSELFFAAGVPIAGNLTEDQKVKASKAALSQAIRGQV
tara:strand:- start:741 stop:1316 length:576 start_codon:yes stop_codon:yes gene_type:complete